VTERILLGETGENPEIVIVGENPEIVIVGENAANLPRLACRAHQGDQRDVAAATAVSPRAVLIRGSIGAVGIVARREGRGGVGRPAENEGLRAKGGAIDDRGSSGTAVATVAVAVLRRLDAPDDTGTTAAAAVVATALKQSIITEGDAKDEIGRRGVR